MRHVHQHTEAVQLPNHARSELRHAVVSDGPSLEITNVVRNIVDQLDHANSAPIGFLKALELSIEEIATLDVLNDGGLAFCFSVLELRKRSHAPNAEAAGKTIHPVQALQVRLV